MRNFVIRLVINALALSGAAYYVDGIELSGGFAEVGVVALIFGLVNAFIRPIVKLFSLPFIFLTLGLFTIVINAAMLILTAEFTEFFSVRDPGAAILGSVVISVISVLMSMVLKEDDD